MKNNKYWLAGIVGGVAIFLLGYLVYGIVLMKYMDEHSGLAADVISKVRKPMEQMNWGAMVVSNMATGFLIATVLSWANFTSAGSGAKGGFIVGLLMTLGFDLVVFSTTNMHTVESLVADILGFVVMTTITGAIVGMILGKGTSSAAS